MMFMKEKLPFGYIPECKCRVLELPYNGEDLSMIILLPNEIEDNSTGLEQVILLFSCYCYKIFVLNKNYSKYDINTVLGRITHMHGQSSG